MSRTKIKRVLVANRGEIACRIFKTLSTLGYETVAVYSDADEDALHVELADCSINIGPGPAVESYLCSDKIISAALERGADAIHPGYGFLSENAEFARACVAAGLIFIGPPAEAISLMGNKAAAKRLMLQAGVPCVPGYQGEDQCDKAMLEAAENIGFPLMVKAAAGGGGRGMRLVYKNEDLVEALALARSEAESAFGSSELILEKSIQKPRHVEFQIFADAQGAVIHMGERDCSVQRRHQKVIEEAPCPVMTNTLRGEMGEAAVKAAKAAGYEGAGTVEFLLDASGEFHFLEMNTRLQVEHPVTEMVTGLDLVALQLSVAEGRPLGLSQADVTFSGHAIEVRLYAEDPAADFLPVTGSVKRWRVPLAVRADSGIRNGTHVSPYYDPMLAKIIVHGANRDEARLKLIAALKNTVLFGTKSNLAFLIACLEAEAFVAGRATTSFIGENFGKDCAQKSIPDDVELAVAAVLEHNIRAQEARNASLRISKSLIDWSNASGLVTPVFYSFGGEISELYVEPLNSGVYLVRGGGVSREVTMLDLEEDTAIFDVDGRKAKAFYFREVSGLLHMAIEGHAFSYGNLVYAAASGEGEVKDGTVAAPMHGLLLSVNIKEGEQVQAGDCLAVLEAMKMQHQIIAEISGIVKAAMCIEGEQVGADQILFEIEDGGSVK